MNAQAKGNLSRFARGIAPQLERIVLRSRRRRVAWTCPVWCGHGSSRLRLRSLLQVSGKAFAYSAFVYVLTLPRPGV